MPTVSARPGWTPARVEAVTRMVADALAGVGAEPYNVVPEIKARVGITALKLIQERAIVLGRGEADRNGYTWDDNALYTIAKKLKISLEEAKQAQVGVDYIIGRDTSLMIRSLAPGVAGPSGNPDQIFALGPRTVAVGTGRKYAERFHRGGPRQPPRPLWSDPVPDEWLQELALAEGEALADAIAHIVSNFDPPPSV